MKVPPCLKQPYVSILTKATQTATPSHTTLNFYFSARSTADDAGILFFKSQPTQQCIVDYVWWFLRTALWRKCSANPADIATLTFVKSPPASTWAWNSFANKNLNCSRTGSFMEKICTDKYNPIIIFNEMALISTNFWTQNQEVQLSTRSKLNYLKRQISRDFSSGLSFVPSHRQSDSEDSAAER